MKSFENSCNNVEIYTHCQHIQIRRAGTFQKYVPEICMLTLSEPRHLDIHRTGTNLFVLPGGASSTRACGSPKKGVTPLRKSKNTATTARDRGRDVMKLLDRDGTNPFQNESV
jgi:hypothetical protein